MKNKKFTIILPIIVLIVISYVNIGKLVVHRKMEAYLKDKSYSLNDIQSMKVNHSFINKLLSYDEWSIKVIYDDEPKAIYFYNYKKKAIHTSGIAGVTEDKLFKHREL